MKKIMIIGIIVMLVSISFVSNVNSVNIPLKITNNTNDSEGFYGYVYDRSGYPINDAELSALKGQLTPVGIINRTNCQGYYDLTGPDMEDYYHEFIVIKEGYKTLEKEFNDEVTDGEKIQIDFVLDLNLPPNKPDFKGPAIGYAGKEVTFQVATSDPDDNKTHIYVNWSENTELITDVPCNQLTDIKHTFEKPGEYKIKIIAQDRGLLESEITYFDITIKENSPPNPPQIDCPTSAKIFRKCNYKFIVNDPDGDDIVSLEVTFSDGATLSINNVWETGSDIDVEHTWSRKGTHTIEARVKDAHESWSEISTLEVSVPKNRAVHNQWFFELLEKWDFPLLSRISNFLG